MLAQAFAELWLRDPIEGRVDAVERLELQKQVGCRLRSDARHPWHVVARVAGQRQVIADLSREDAELLADLVRTVDAIAHRVPQDDLRAIASDELHEVFVRAHDDDAHPLGHRASGHGGDEIVCLEPARAEARDVPCADHLFDPRHLLGQVGRRRGPCRLVATVEVMAKSGAGRVHGHGQHVGSPLADNLLKHIDRAEHGVGRLAARAREGRQRVIGAKHVAREIHEVKNVPCPRLGQGGGARRRGSGDRSALPVGICTRHLHGLVSGGEESRLM